MSNNNFQDISEILKSLAYIPEINLQFPEDSFCLAKMAKALPSSVLPDHFTDQLTEISKIVSDLSKSTYAALESVIISPGIFNFLNDIDFQSGYIELNEDNCDSINSILESSNIANAPLKVSKGKFSLTNLLSLLISILGILLSIHYHKIDSVESQKSSMREYQLKKEENRLLKEQLHIQERELQVIDEHTKFLENTINELIDHIKSQENSQAIPESDSEIFEFPMSSAEHPESPDEVQDRSDVIADEFDSP